MYQLREGHDVVRKGITKHAVFSPYPGRTNTDDWRRGSGRSGKACGSCTSSSSSTELYGTSIVLVLHCVCNHNLADDESAGGETLLWQVGSGGA